MAKISLYHQDLAKVANLLPTLCGNILVTGSTGLIGGCLVDLLMHYSQCNVYALGRNNQRASKRFNEYRENNRFHFLQHDICAPLDLDIDFDYIIHAASNASPNFFQQQPVEVMRSNMEGLCHLVEYGIHHNMRRMVYVSSGEVYGECSDSVFTETSSGYIDILSPRSCYPSSKRAAETLCTSYCQEYGCEIVIARPCHTYGPFFTESDNRVYAQFIRNVLRGENIVMKSLGQQYRSWIYVVDCAAAILLLLERGHSGEAYNIANEESNITIRQLAEKTAAIADRKVIIDACEEGNTTPISHAVFSTQKLESLGWHPLFTIEEGLRHTIDAMS